MPTLDPITLRMYNNNAGAYKSWPNNVVQTLLSQSISAAQGSTTASTGGLSFPLADGHFVPSKGSMSLIYPRPNAETNTWARHRWAYYDGTNAVEYNIPIGVRLGAPPYQFTLLEGPTGMTVGRYWGDANYGRVIWTPSGNVTDATVTVQVRDQELNSIEVTWTVTTSSSVDRFIFLDATNGNDSTGTGAFSTPFQTFAKAVGTTASANFKPGAICYLKAGTYTVPSQTGSGVAATTELTSTLKPMSFIGIGSVTLTLSTAGFFWSSEFDIAFQNLTCNSGVSSVNNFYSFFMGDTDRVLFDRVTQTNPVNGSAGDSNVSTLFFSSQGSYRDYIYVKDCAESGRSGGNSYGLVAAFCVRNSLFEGCTVSNSSALHDLYLKASIADCTVRYCTLTNVAAVDSCFATGTQVDSAGPNQNIEICYNTISGVSNQYGASILNYSDTSPGTHWFYRNTLRGRSNVRDGSAAGGPYTQQNNAIQASSPQATWGYSNSGNFSGHSITNTGTECQATSGVLDSNNKLTGTYRTNYLGMRGAEIA